MLVNIESPAWNAAVLDAGEQIPIAVTDLDDSVAMPVPPSQANQSENTQYTHNRWYIWATENTLGDSLYIAMYRHCIDGLIACQPLSWVRSGSI